MKQQQTDRPESTYPRGDKGVTVRTQLRAGVWGATCRRPSSGTYIERLHDCIDNFKKHESLHRETIDDYLPYCAACASIGGVGDCVNT